MYDNIGTVVWNHFSRYKQSLVKVILAECTVNPLLSPPGGLFISSPLILKGFMVVQNSLKSLYRLTNLEVNGFSAVHKKVKSSLRAE